MSLSAMESRVRKSRELLIQLGHTGRTRQEKYKKLLSAFFTQLKAPARLSLDVWMDENFYLPSESASEHGAWRTDRFPFLRRPSHKLSPASGCKTIGAAKGAQLGFTTLITGWKLYIADQGLGPTLYVQPTKEAVIEYSEQKLQPAIDLCKKIEDKLGAKRGKHLASTKLRKYFPGGYIALGSANSAPTLRSKSIRNLVIDEEDGCNQDVGGEGSSVQLAIRRTANFPDAKICRISTPINTDTSSIWPYCLNGTAERFLVPCPHCNKSADKYGTNFEIKWELIKYNNRDPATAYLMCPSCGESIGEHQKTWMLGNAFWYKYNPSPKAGFADDERRQSLLVELEKIGYYNMSRDNLDYISATSIPDDDEAICTFFISSLYSPLGFYSWRTAVADWLDANARNDKSLLKTFFNTVLGLPWKDTATDVDYRGLKTRQEILSPYGTFDIPANGLVVTMGVDVQKDRLEAHVISIGENDEIFVIDYKVFYGDTAILGDHEYKFNGVLTCWGQLKEFLPTKYKHESGAELPIECTLIDSRYRSQYVFPFCRAHEQQRVYSVYGTDGWGRGFIERPTKKNRYGVWVFHAMSDELKTKLYSMLRNENPGPGYVHFSRTVEYPTMYFKGLVIEELKIKRQGGTDVYYWENPSGGRNEPLDTWCYAYTAFLTLRLNLAARRAVLEKHILRQFENSSTAPIPVKKSIKRRINV